MVERLTTVVGRTRQAVAVAGGLAVVGITSRILGTNPEILTELLGGVVAGFQLSPWAGEFQTVATVSQLLMFFIVFAILTPRAFPSDARPVTEARSFRLLVATLAVAAMLLLPIQITAELVAPFSAPSATILAEAGLSVIYLLLFAGFSIAAYIGWWTDWETLNPEQAITALSFETQTGLQPQMSRRYADQQGLGWLGDVIWYFDIGLTSGIRCVALGATTGLLSLFGALPEILVLCGIIGQPLAKLIPDKIHISQTAVLDVEEPLYASVSMLGRKGGTAAVLFVYFGIAVAGVPLFVEISLPGDSKGIANIWRAIGVTSCLYGAVGYALWFWTRELSRLPYSLPESSVNCSNEESLTSRDLPIRPTGLLVPSAVPLLGVAGLTYGWFATPLFDITWPIMIGVLVAAFVTTRRLQPQLPTTEWYTLPVALAVYLVSVVVLVVGQLSRFETLSSRTLRWLAGLAYLYLFLTTAFLRHIESPSLMRRFTRLHWVSRIESALVDAETQVGRHVTSQVRAFLFPLTAWGVTLILLGGSVSRIILDVQVTGTVRLALLLSTVVGASLVGLGPRRGWFGSSEGIKLSLLFAVGGLLLSNTGPTQLLGSAAFIWLAGAVAFLRELTGGAALPPGFVTLAAVAFGLLSIGFGLDPTLVNPDEGIPILSFQSLTVWGGTWLLSKQLLEMDGKDESSRGTRNGWKWPSVTPGVVAGSVVGLVFGVGAVLAVADPRAAYVLPAIVVVAAGLILLVNKQPVGPITASPRLEGVGIRKVISEKAGLETTRARQIRRLAVVIPAVTVVLTVGLLLTTGDDLPVLPALDQVGGTDGSSGTDGFRSVAEATGGVALLAIAGAILIYSRHVSVYSVGWRRYLPGTVLVSSSVLLGISTAAVVYLTLGLWLLVLAMATGNSGRLRYALGAFYFIIAGGIVGQALFVASGLFLAATPELGRYLWVSTSLLGAGYVALLGIGAAVTHGLGERVVIFERWYLQLAERWLY